MADTAITLIPPTTPSYGTSAQKSALRRMYEASLGRAIQVQSEVHPYTRALVQSVRSEGGALLTGGILGWVDTTYGLDKRIGDSVLPIDGVASLGLTILSLAMARDPDGLAIDVRNAAAVCTGVYAFRQVKRWQESMNTQSSVAGERGSRDPILECAANLG